MIEAIRLALLSGTVGGTVLAMLVVILKQGPEALKTVLSVLTRRRLIRLAVESPDEHVRRRARDLLKLLESAPGKPEKRPAPNSIEGPSG